MCSVSWWGPPIPPIIPRRPYSGIKGYLQDIYQFIERASKPYAEVKWIYEDDKNLKPVFQVDGWDAWFFTPKPLYLSGNFYIYTKDEVMSDPTKYFNERVLMDGIKNICQEWLRLKYESIPQKNREVLYIDNGLSYPSHIEKIEITNEKSPRFKLQGIEQSIEWTNLRPLTPRLYKIMDKQSSQIKRLEGQKNISMEEKIRHIEALQTSLGDVVKQVEDLKHQLESKTVKIDELTKEKHELEQKLQTKTEESNKEKNEQNQLSKKLRARIAELTRGSGSESSFPNFGAIISEFSSLGTNMANYCIKVFESEIKMSEGSVSFQNLFRPQFLHCVLFYTLIASYEEIDKIWKENLKCLKDLFMFMDEKKTEVGCQTIFQDQYMDVFNKFKDGAIKNVIKNACDKIQEENKYFKFYLQKLQLIMYCNIDGEEGKDANIYLNFVEKCLLSMWCCKLSRPRLEPFPRQFKNSPQLMHQLKIKNMQNFQTERFGTDESVVETLENIGYYVWPSLMYCNDNQFITNTAIKVCYVKIIDSNEHTDMPEIQQYITEDGREVEKQD